MALAVMSAGPIFGQADQPDTNSGGAVLHEPFSAISYIRVVKVSPDGKRQFIRNVQYPMRLARDSAGRIRLDVVPNPPPEECDQMEMLTPPVCSSWPVVIFDPHAQTMTHWAGGAFGYHGPVVIKLSPAQMDDAESSTLAMPKQPTADSLDDSNVTFEQLGERKIDGVRAAGTRMTRVLWLDQGEGGSGVRTVHIREVWISEPMHLVVRIIDGDPNGEETIAGLDHISLGDHSDLFQLPSGYPVRFSDNGRFLGNDLSLLASWFVQLPGQGDWE
ncbi:MAG: hypothetical protein WBG54_16050 [Acidobacteriaceae bacterium]